MASSVIPADSIILVSASTESLTFTAGECKVVNYTFDLPSGYRIIDVYDSSYYANLVPSLIRIHTGASANKATMNYYALVGMTHVFTAVAVCAPG